jgi:diacylglycerol kinase family enzyme
MWVESSSPAVADRHASAGPPLFVLANPASGDHDASGTRQALSLVFEAAGRAAEFVPVANPDRLHEAAAAAASRARDCGGILVAVGGDGTINTVAAAALRHGCPLGVIAQGTFNYFARAYGIPQDAQAAARALLRARPEPVQVGWLNEQLFLVNASLGFYPQVLEDREAFKAQLGRRRWVALLSGLVTLFEWRRQLSLEIELEGERIRVRTPTLFVCNNRLQLEGIGIDAQVTARVGAGCLGAIVVKPIGTLAMFALGLRGAFGKLGEADQVLSFAFRSLEVRPRRGRALKAATDGEVRRMRAPLRFSVSPDPLMLMVPSAEDRVPVQ